MEKKHFEVAAALIWNGARFLIGKRPKNKTQAGLWEFVGGKAEKGETLETALVRECHEEIGVTIEPYGVFFETHHEYEDAFVHLTVFHAKIVEGEPSALEHEALAWILPSEIPLYAFCPADTEMLDILQKEQPHR